MKIIRESEIANSAIETMVNSFSSQHEPELGIFWYDTKNDELFGTYHTLHTDVPFYHSPQWKKDVRTCNKLHKTVWTKEHFRGKDKRFNGDYTQVPRGRIFEFKDEGFIVFVGDWFDKYPQVQELILDEFDLPKDQTTFQKDEHWNLGRGWSQEF